MNNGSQSLRNTRSFTATLIRNTICGVLLLSSVSCQSGEPEQTGYGTWAKLPASEWPQITMINQIDYIDKHHPIGGCGFLLDTGDDTLAVTAKHVLIYFKSEQMSSVSFGNSLVRWRMFPKNNPNDLVEIDQLINENPEEPLKDIPASKDWVLFSIKQATDNIQPLRFRESPLTEGEPVYIVGWRYSDKNCPQVVYKGNFVEYDEGSVLISTERLSDNTMPGLSGSPVIDSNGYLIGLMSQKAGKLERVSSIEYPKQILATRSKAIKSDTL